MFENPRRGRQAKNFTTNVSKILDFKSSSEQIFFRKLSLGSPVYCETFNDNMQLFRGRLSEKVHMTILRGTAGGFEFTLPQRNLKEWHERSWTHVCKC